MVPPNTVILISLVLLQESFGLGLEHYLFVDIGRVLTVMVGWPHLTRQCCRAPDPVFLYTIPLAFPIHAYVRNVLVFSHRAAKEMWDRYP